MHLKLREQCESDTWIGDYEYTGSSEIIGCLAKI